MMLNLIDRLGSWNPQLVRELKGRLNVFNVAIAVVTSLLGQLLLFLYQLREFPGNNYSVNSKYCGLGIPYYEQTANLRRQYDQLQEQLGRYNGAKNYNPAKIDELGGKIAQLKQKMDDLDTIIKNRVCPPNEIDMQLWWRDHYEYIFLALSGIFAFTLLVAGTYLLINNLAQEERRGTLNFIRLSSQSEASILTGKILGVPILIYIFTALAVPLHLYSGVSAQIPLSRILIFYGVLIASCIFFYTVALLFGLVNSWLGSFQAPLGSGTVLAFLLITKNMASLPTGDGYINEPIEWLYLLSPFLQIAYLFPKIFNGPILTTWYFFNLPIGASVVNFIGFSLLNYALCTYWFWQGLKRCFRNPNATILSKRQSYLLVAWFQVMIWGFIVQEVTRFSFNGNSDGPYQIIGNLFLLYFFNFVLLCGLIAVLSPQRQALQDWARYRHQKVSNRHLLQDLIWGEKSPALVAMAINLVIATTPFVVWVLLLPAGRDNIYTNRFYWWLPEGIDKTKLLLPSALLISMMMICATIAQIILLMKTPKRSLGAIGAIAATLLLTPIILAVLGINSSTSHIWWLFSIFPWAGIQYATTTTIFMVFLGELCVLALLILQLRRQLRKAGESASKALFSQ